MSDKELELMFCRRLDALGERLSRPARLADLQQWHATHWSTIMPTIFHASIHPAMRQGLLTATEASAILQAIESLQDQISSVPGLSDLAIALVPTASGQNVNSRLQDHLYVSGRVSQAGVHYPENI